MKQRLYILTSEDLNPVYAMVQGGHGVAQWLLDHEDQTWDNGYLIYLKADLEKWKRKLELLNKDFSEFHEPDLKGKLTALSILDDG